jgi:ADP-ribosylation factor GTPase-activating protein 2/3
LGAKKAAAPIDFDAVERKAREEEERKAKLLEEERLAKEKAMEEALKAKGLSAPTVTNNKTSSTTNGKDATSPAPDMERLGMGMRKMGFGSAAGNVSSGSSKKYP